MLENYKHLCIVGDIHGEFTEFVFKIWSLGLQDTAFIVAGDFGVGFYKRGYYDKVWEKIKKKLETRGNILLGIRGNHDDPEYYTAEGKLDYPLFKTIPDLTELTWGDRKILVIGGAQSTDQDIRLKEMSRKRDSKVIWWAGERPKFDLSELPIKADIVISHEAPIQLGPVVTRSEDMSLEIYQNIIKDREALGTVLKETRPDRWYFGHYHESFSGTWGETLYKGLDINEIVEVYDFSKD